jgi:hypothetical protein
MMPYSITSRSVLEIMEGGEIGSGELDVVNSQVSAGENPSELGGGDSIESSCSREMRNAVLI